MSFHLNMPCILLFVVCIYSKMCKICFKYVVRMLHECLHAFECIIKSCMFYILFICICHICETYCKHIFPFFYVFWYCILRNIRLHFIFALSVAKPRASNKGGKHGAKITKYWKCCKVKNKKNKNPKVRINIFEWFWDIILQLLWKMS